MKKLFALLLTGAVTLSLFGCGKKLPPQTEAPTTEPTPAATEPATDPVTEAGGVQVKQIDRVAYLENDFYGGFLEYLYEYDPESRTLTVSDPERKLEEHTFFEGTTQVQSISYFWEPGPACQYQEYDLQGNLILDAEYEDGEEVSRRDYTYREDGLLLREMVYSGGIETIAERHWGYDAAGNQTEYTEYELGEQVHHSVWIYDSKGNVLKHDVDGIYGDYEYYDHETFTYDAAGRLTESTHHGDDPASCWDYRVEYTYDDADRLIGQKSFHDNIGTSEDTWQYDDQGRLIKRVETSYMDGWWTAITEYTYNEAGLLTKETLVEDYEYGEAPGAGTEITYEYDDAGRLLREIHSTGGEQDFSIRHEYDADGNKTLTERISDDVTALVECSYDEAGTLTAVTKDGEALLSGELQQLTLESGIELLLGTEYALLTVEEEKTSEIEEINQYILGLLEERD